MNLHSAILGRPSYRETVLSNRLNIVLNQEKLFTSIDANPEIAGAGVVYIDSELNTITLREFTPLCSVQPITVVLREPLQPLTTSEHAASLKGAKRESKLVLEAVSAGVACTGAVLS